MCSSKLPWQRERREKLGEQAHNVYLKVTILRSPVSLFVKKSPVPAKLRENKQTVSGSPSLENPKRELIPCV
jgi:hypothetical protein